MTRSIENGIPYIIAVTQMKYGFDFERKNDYISFRFLRYVL